MIAPGRKLGNRYVVGGLLGRGGMADVYAATDTAAACGVALKLLREPRAAGRTQFRTEADTLARLDHPGLVGMRGRGSHEGRPFLVLDLAGGPPLAREVAAGPLGLGRTRAVGAQVAGALAHAHDAGVVHRDVKPSNILLDAPDRARLSDFGIAQVRGAPSTTRPGYVLGSPPYVAPEQVEGRAATPASDVYALGLVLLECLTGRRCYGGSRAEAAVARLRTPPPVPRALPAWLRDVLRAMTDRAPTQRPSAAAVAAALRTATSERARAGAAAAGLGPARHGARLARWASRLAAAAAPVRAEPDLPAGPARGALSPAGAAGPCARRPAGRGG